MEGKGGELRLTIELIPSSTWGMSLRKLASVRDWSKIRERCIKENKNRCGICDTKGRLSCHEIWEFDDLKHIQRLVGFNALCNMCHSIKHIGNTLRLAKEGKLDYESVVRHFVEVNRCSSKTFYEHREAEYKKWKGRSRHEWEVDFGEYKNILDKKKMEKPRTYVLFGKPEERGWG